MIFVYDVLFVIDLIWNILNNFGLVSFCVDELLFYMLRNYMFLIYDVGDDIVKIFIVIVIM